MKQEPIILKAVAGQAEYERVRAAASADGHAHMEPNVQLLRAGEVVGCLNLGRITLCHSWLRSDLGARETLQAFALVELRAAAAGVAALGLPVGPESPLYRHLDGRLGYQRWLEGMIFTKRL